MSLTLGLTKITGKNLVAKLHTLTSLTEVLSTREWAIMPVPTPKLVRIGMHQSAGREASNHSQQTYGKQICPVRSPRPPDTCAIQLEDWANGSSFSTTIKTLLPYIWAVSSCSYPQITCVYFCARPYQQEKRCTCENHETHPRWGANKVRFPINNLYQDVP